ncbi:MAG: FkbM family methyltransferase [Chlorobi bacterium CHB2]|nr:FkbM family methyltransferase [Chlorobi bacterium CHB2]
MRELFKRIQKAGIGIEHACEVGVYLPESSNILEFLQLGIRGTLVEANPEMVEKIHRYFAGRANVRIYPYAMWDSDGEITLAHAKSSTFVAALGSSPALKNDNYTIAENNSFTVQCRTFSRIDDGTIDLLSIDIEGADWYVLKHLVSRPKVISVETHGKYYVNPFLDSITSWMEREGYVAWYKDGSDTIYVRKGLITLRLTDRLALCSRNLRLAMRRAKGKLKRLVRF